MFNFYTYMSVRTALSSMLVVAALVLLAPLAVQAFYSSETVDLTGYAWSHTVGWISFESGDGANVTINTNGTVTGYGWSPHIGWVKFGGLGSFPGSGSNAQMVDVGSGTYELRGWARACAGTATGDCTTMTSRTDGWDGWIALNGSNHAVRFTSTGPVANSYAWGGGTVIGWVDMFSRVSFNNLPASATLAVTGCGITPGESSCDGSVSWQFSNADNPRVQKTQPLASMIFSSGASNDSGSENPHTMQLGINAFETRDDSGVLDTALVDVSCVANASLDGGVCECDTGYMVDANSCIVDPDADPTGSLSISPILVRKNQDVTTTWNTDASACTVTTSQGDSVSGGATGSQSFTITSSNQVQVTLTCDGVEVDTAVIRVLPTIFES